MEVAPVIDPVVGSTFQYSPVGQVLKDFQPLIVALFGFTTIAGALYGIRLKGNIDDRASQKVKFENRLATATMVRSFVLSEDLFRDLSLLTYPTITQIHRMVDTGTILELKASEYMTYLANISATLRDFPRPIAERSAFISWISARVLLACAQHKPTDGTAQISDEAIKQIRYLVVAGIMATKDLAFELGEYQNHQQYYEARWCPDQTYTGWRKKKVKNWPDRGYHWERTWEGMRSNAFDLKEVLMQLAYMEDKERTEELWNRNKPQSASQ
jgi:hypothetical protein